MRVASYRRLLALAIGLVLLALVNWTATAVTPEEQLRDELVALAQAAETTMFNAIAVGQQVLSFFDVFFEQSQTEPDPNQILELERQMMALEQQALDHRNSLFGLQNQVLDLAAQKGLTNLGIERLEELIVLIKKKIQIVVTVSIWVEETIIIIFKKRVRCGARSLLSECRSAARLISTARGLVAATFQLAQRLRGVSILEPPPQNLDGAGLEREMLALARTSGRILSSLQAPSQAALRNFGPGSERLEELIVFIKKCLQIWISIGVWFEERIIILFKKRPFLPPVGAATTPSQPLEVDQIQVLPTKEGITMAFRAQGNGIIAMSVTVFDLSGRQIFRSEERAGAEVLWLLTSANRTVPNGVYLYLVTARGPDGQIVQSKVYKFVVLR